MREIREINVTYLLSQRLHALFCVTPRAHHEQLDYVVESSRWGTLKTLGNETKLALESGGEQHNSYRPCPPSASSAMDDATIVEKVQPIS